MRILALACIPIAVLVYAGAARCQDRPSDELERWVPSFGFAGGILRQTASGFEQYALRPPDDGIDPPETPGVPITGSGSLVDPSVVFTTELMTPGLRSLPGTPRLFVHGEVGGAFGAKVKFASEGNPGPFVVPDDTSLAAIAVGGQGMAADAEVGPLVASGGLGIAFTADLFGRRLRVKPSFEYLRHAVDVTGVLHHAIKATDSNGNPYFMLISLKEEQKRTLDSIGGGLELEMDTLRLGPFVLSLFASGQTYQLLSDPQFRLSASDGTNPVTWKVTLDRDIYRGLAGLRFRYLPEP